MMANLLEDIQCVSSDTRPPMLDRTDFASWQQRIRPYYRGPERPRVYSDLISEEKNMYNTDIRATNIILQGELRTELGMVIWVKQGRLSATTAMENGVALDEEQLLFIADNVFQADDYDAFDFDVNEAPTAQIMFMANISSAYPVYDEAVHEMHDDVQPNYGVDSHVDYTSDNNMIPYNQYVKDNAVPVVQSNVSAVPNDAYMMILNDMHEPPVQHVSVTTQNNVVDK
nr:hypothetical protein [Tanacetum cinerariifolium]